MAHRIKDAVCYVFEVKAESMMRGAMTIIRLRGLIMHLASLATKHLKSLGSPHHGKRREKMTPKQEKIKVRGAQEKKSTEKAPQTTRQEKTCLKNAIGKVLPKEETQTQDFCKETSPGTTKKQEEHVTHKDADTKQPGTQPIAATGAERPTVHNMDRNATKRV